jgi:hypothetical protein
MGLGGHSVLGDVDTQVEGGRNFHVDQTDNALPVEVKCKSKNWEKVTSQFRRLASAAWV